MFIERGSARNEPYEKVDVSRVVFLTQPSAKFSIINLEAKFFCRTIEIITINIDICLVHHEILARAPVKLSGVFVPKVA